MQSFGDSSASCNVLQNHSCQTGFLALLSRIVVIALLIVKRSICDSICKIKSTALSNFSSPCVSDCWLMVLLRLCRVVLSFEDQTFGLLVEYL